MQAFALCKDPLGFEMLCCNQVVNALWPPDRVRAREQTMDVHSAFPALADREVPEHLMSTVNEADARAARAASMGVKGVVKANPLAPRVPETPADMLAGSDPSTARLRNHDGLSLTHSC